MAIQFECPHCKRSLKVRDEWAGRKARCPACQKLLTIGAAAADVEALAAAAFESQSADTTPVPATVDFRCGFCDEDIHASADLAGKQMPCPHCKRIVKVPVLAPQGLRDWRKPDSLPSAARRDAGPTPEGAWGTNTSATRVSSEALAEAKALPTPARRPRTARERIVLGTAALVATVVIVVGAVGMVRYRARSQQEQALGQAETALAGKGQPLPAGVMSADLWRASGEYHLRDGDIQKAYDRLKRARARLAEAKPESLEREFLLVDLAMTQTEFLGDPEFIRRGSRWGWQDTREELRRTMLLLASPDARAAAVREVSRRLLARRPGLRVDEIVSTLGKESERPELLAIAGLELLRTKRRDEAQDIARRALASFQVKPHDSKESPRRGPISASLLALLIGLDQQPAAEKEVAAAPSPRGEIDEEVRVGYALGWALAGKHEAARALAQRPGGGNARLLALVAIAEAVVDTDHALAAADAMEAFSLFAGDVKAATLSPWVLTRFLTVALQTGAVRSADPILPAIERPEIRRRLELEAVRFRLIGPPQADMTALGKAAQTEPADPLLLEALARLNTRAGNGQGVAKEVRTWHSDTRAFGYMGIALGIQDQHHGSEVHSAKKAR